KTRPGDEINIKPVRARGGIDRDAAVSDGRSAALGELADVEAVALEEHGLQLRARAGQCEVTVAGARLEEARDLASDPDIREDGVRLEHVGQVGGVLIDIEDIHRAS